MIMRQRKKTKKKRSSDSGHENRPSDACRFAIDGVFVSNETYREFYGYEETAYLFPDSPEGR